MSKLMFEDTAIVGNKIRAYDFVPRKERKDCYVEGEILYVPFETSDDLFDKQFYDRYKIQRVTKL